MAGCGGSANLIGKPMEMAPGVYATWGHGEWVNAVGHDVSGLLCCVHDSNTGENTFTMIDGSSPGVVKAFAAYGSSAAAGIPAAVVGRSRVTANGGNANAVADANAKATSTATVDCPPPHIVH